jgi:hypothetical protein
MREQQRRQLVLITLHCAKLALQLQLSGLAPTRNSFRFVSRSEYDEPACLPFVGAITRARATKATTPHRRSTPQLLPAPPVQCQPPSLFQTRCDLHGEAQALAQQWLLCRTMVYRGHAQNQRLFGIFPYPPLRMLLCRLLPPPPRCILLATLPWCCAVGIGCLIAEGHTATSRSAVKYAAPEETASSNSTTTAIALTRKHVCSGELLRRLALWYLAVHHPSPHDN